VKNGLDHGCLECLEWLRLFVQYIFIYMYMYLQA